MLLFKFMVFLLVDCFRLWIDDAGLNEKCANIAVVIASEVCKGTRVAWSAGNDEKLARSFSLVS